MPAVADRRRRLSVALYWRPGRLAAKWRFASGELPRHEPRKGGQGQLGTNIRWAEEPGRDKSRDRGAGRGGSLGRGVVRLLIVAILLAGTAVGSGCLGGDACAFNDYLGAIDRLPDAMLGAGEGDIVSALVTLTATLGAAVMVIAMLVWIALGFGAGRQD